MRVLHAPLNIAGQMTLLTSELRSLGVDCKGMQLYSPKFGYETDFNLNSDKTGRLGKYFRQLKFFLGNFLKFDIFHFYFGLSLLPFHLDLPILKLLGKKIVFHFRGSDIRNPNYVKQLGRGSNVPITTLKQRINLLIIKLFSDKNLVSTPDLIELVGEKAFYLPNGVDLTYWTANHKQDSGKIFVLHAPSSRGLKGTEIIIKAVETIKKNNNNVELLLVEGVKASETKNFYRRSDVVVDQLLIGWYGNFSIECMALGIPVICFIREDLRKKYAPELPIVNSTKESLFGQLDNLIKSRGLRQELRKKGRGFVERTHDSKKIALKLKEIYQNL